MKFCIYKQIFLSIALIFQVIKPHDDDYKFIPTIHISLRSHSCLDENESLRGAFKNLNETSPGSATVQSGWYVSTGGPTVHGQGLDHFSLRPQNQFYGSSSSYAQKEIESAESFVTQKENLRLLNLNDPVVVAVLKAQLGNERLQELIASVHQRKYGVTYDFLWGSKDAAGLYQTRDFDKVASWIVATKELSKEQALEVWQGYCNKRVVGGDRKINGRRLIVKEYDRRIDKENKRIHDLAQAQRDAEEKLRIENISRTAALRAQEEQAALIKKQGETDQVRLTTQKEILQKRLQHLGLDPEQHVYLPQDFELLKQEYECCDQLCSDMLEHDLLGAWEHRKKAINKTIEQGFAQSWHEVELSPQAQGYLAAQGMSSTIYRSCYGTFLQHQLHTEVCALFESVAQAQLGAFQKSSFLNMATSCGDASFMANDFEAIDWAICLQDLGSACCKVGKWTIENGPKYLKATGEGVVESAWDFVHMVSHPGEMIENIGKAAWFVMDTIALADEESMGGSLPVAAEYRKKRFDIIDRAVIALEDGIANSTGPQRAKMVIKFAADCVFQHKALQAVGAVAGVMRVNGSTLRTMEHVADVIAHESDFALAGESIARATQEIEIILQKSVQQELVQLSEAMPVKSLGEVVEQSVKIMRSFGEVISHVAQYGKIPAINQSTLQDFVCQDQQRLQNQNQQYKANIKSKESQIEFTTPPDDPDENKDKKKRTYTGASYHHQNSRGGSFGGKSPPPKDGQKSLDRSISFKEKGNQKYERRLGVEEDYFVIFDEHLSGEFHGHISTWEDLTREMRNALYQAGIVKNPKTGKM